MTTTIPCRAKDPNTCPFHGPQLRAEAALNRGDLNTWLKETETMLANSSIDEVQAFAANQAAPAAPTTEPLTAQQVMELPIGSEAVAHDGTTWRKTQTGGWSQIQSDGTLGIVTRNSRYFTLENKPTLKTIPAGAVPTPHYQPGYPKQTAWQHLQPGDQISGGKVVSVRPTTTTNKVNVTIEHADGTTKTFAASKHNKQTVVGNANTAPAYAQHDLDYRLSRAGVSLDDRIQLGTGRADNFTYTVGGTESEVKNQPTTPARTIYNQIAHSLLNITTLEPADEHDTRTYDRYINHDKLLSTLQSARAFAATAGRLDGKDPIQREEVDVAHRHVFTILTQPYGNATTRGGIKDRIPLRTLLAALDKAYWEKPTPVAK